MIRVTLNGCVCDRETIDHVTEVDGKGDEVRFTWSVSSNLGNDGGVSSVYGDINGHPERTLAGTRSNLGGIRSGDSIPFPAIALGPPGLMIPRLPWSSQEKDEFPITLWVGDPAPGETIKIAPLVWEIDDSFSNPGPGIQLANAIAVAISTVVGFGDIGAAIGRVVAEIANIIGVAGDRVVGTEINKPDPNKTDWPLVVITADNVESLLNRDLGLGKGIITLVQTDPPSIGAGSYRMFVQVSRI